MRALFATPMAALIATAGLTLGASGTAAAMTITLSDPNCMATGANLVNGNVDITVSCTSTTPPTAGAPTGCTLSASPSAPAAGQAFSVTGRCTGGTAPITFALSSSTGSLGNLTQSSANSASSQYSTTAGAAGTTYTYTAVASNGTAPDFNVPQLSVTVASPPPPPPPSTGTPNCSAQGFANTRHIRLDWNNLGKVYYSKDVGSFGPDDALVLELTVPTTATVTNTLRTISGAEWIDLGVPRSAFLSTKACDFSTSVFGYGSESAGTSFGVSFAVGSANSAGRWGFPNPVPPKVAPGTTVYLNIKNSTAGSCGSGSCNVFATFK